VNHPVTTRTKNVTSLRSQDSRIHAGFVDEWPDGAAKGWPLRAHFLLCRSGKVRKTNTYFDEVERPVDCIHCLRRLAEAALAADYR
jgi:hypothetical protein